jgi:hypothetical protein
MCDLTGFWRPVACAAKSGSAAWQVRERAVRERVATHFAIERMVESYRAVWQRAQQGAPVMANEQEAE